MNVGDVRTSENGDNILIIKTDGTDFGYPIEYKVLTQLNKGKIYSWTEYLIRINYPIFNKKLTDQQIIKDIIE